MARRIKKVEGGHAHHGGAWKVAYADFVTAMMALFMVMWLLASTDAKTRQEISRYFRTGILPEGDMAMASAAQVIPSVIEQSPTPPQPGKASLEEQAKAAQEVTGALEHMASIDAELARVIENVRVTVTPDGVLIETVDAGDSLLFDVSSAKLNQPLQKFLRAMAPVLVGLDKNIEINGHTDARPFPAGSRYSNWDLSYQRAAAARQILEEAGLPGTKVVGVFARASSQRYFPDQPLG